MSKKTKEQLKIYIVYDEHETPGDCIDPEEAWPSYEDGHKELTIIGLYKSNSGILRCYNGFVITEPSLLELSHVYLVVVRFYDGSTFGRTCGYHEFWSIRATREEASMDEAIIRAEQKPGDRTYRSWDGYFSGLEDVEIHRLPLQP